MGSSGLGDASLMGGATYRAGHRGGPHVTAGRPVLGLLGLALTGGLMLAGGPGDPAAKKVQPPQARADAGPAAAKAGTVWKQTFTVEYNSSLPVSVAFAADGKLLLTGDTNGEVMAVRCPS